MDQKSALSFILEVIWWLFTLFVVIALLYPIYSNAVNYPFYSSNILFIVVFITFARLLFFLKHTFLANREYLKVGIILFSAIIVFLLVNQLNFFQTYLDERGFEGFLGHLSLDRQKSMGGYIRKEMLFFGVGSIILPFCYPSGWLYLFGVVVIWVRFEINE